MLTTPTRLPNVSHSRLTRAIVAVLVLGLSDGRLVAHDSARSPSRWAEVTLPMGDVAKARPVGGKASFIVAGTTDPDVVRRVVAVLGTGRKVDVKTTAGEHFRARIRAIEEDSFTVTRGRLETPQVIPYAQVADVRPAGMHWAAKVALGVGAVIGAGLLGFLLCASSGDCVQ